MRVVLSTFARAAVAVLCGVAASPIATAQPAAPTPPPAPAGPVRQITVDEAVRLALEQNLSLRVQRLNPEIQDQNVLQAHTAWRPTLTGNFTYNNTETPPDSFLSGSTATLQSSFTSGSGGVQQLLPWAPTTR